MKVSEQRSFNDVNTFKTTISKRIHRAKVHVLDSGFTINSECDSLLLASCNWACFLYDSVQAHIN